MIHFIKEFNELAELASKISKNHGWHENWNDGEKIALMHSELSEGLEAIRSHITNSEHIPKFKGIEEELADVIIRIMDFQEYHNLNIAKAIIAKMEFNNTRAYKHGGKEF